MWSSLVLAWGCGHKPGIDALYTLEPPRNSLTFWGHASSYVDVDGFGIVFDPVFDPAYGILHRRMVAAPPPSAYDQAQVILISHAHSDHLSTETLGRFPESATVLCSEESAAYLTGLDAHVETMNPGDRYPFPGGRIVAVPASHPGGRWSLDAEPDGRALGFVIETPRVTLYYSGDSDYFAGFAAIGRLYAPDIALVNINAHLNDEDALRAIEALGAPLVIPTHHGAYFSVNELRTPYWHQELERVLGSRFMRVGVGESVPLSGSGAP